MTWDYRVIEFGDDDPYRAIHEVYYKDGKPEYYTERPASALWATHEGMWDDPHKILNQMMTALDKPVLHASNFEEE